MQTHGRRRPSRDRKGRVRLGSILRGLRADAGLSQDALAEATGITKVRISRLEGGLVRLLAEEIPVLCSALGIGAYRLLQPADERA